MIPLLGDPSGEPECMGELHVERALLDCER
jgi:hypothetical protein